MVPNYAVVLLWLSREELGSVLFHEDRMLWAFLLKDNPLNQDIMETGSAVDMQSGLLLQGEFYNFMYGPTPLFLLRN